VNALRAIRQAVFPAIELVLGMGVAQVIATAQVYFSNCRLFAQMTAVAQAGFLPVPNPTVLPRLLDLENAFYGGLLLTLSVGAGLSLLSAAAARLWHRCASGRRFAAAVPVAILAGAVVCMNRGGFDAWATLYLLTIPPTVFWLAGGSRRPCTVPRDARGSGLRFLPLAALALGWFTQYDQSLLIDVRDHLLLSNPVGGSISWFYYRYTLYPAEAIKNFDQRLIKTVAIHPADAIGHPTGWTRELIRLDYLPVDDTVDADLCAHVKGDRLEFSHRGKTVWEGTLEGFLDGPRQAAADISARADRFASFRAVAFYGVLLAFPAAIYFLLFALLRMLCGVAAGGRWAEAVAAAVCLLIGFAALAYLHIGREDPPPPGASRAALESDRWQRRVAGLRAVRGRNLDIRSIPGYAAMLRSPYPQERCWLAHALAASPDPEASADLIRLLDDPQINVRTMALEALGRRRDPRAVNPILRLLKTSAEWYDQLYAYHALRALRWDQTRLH
jgi:hypothetical protein